MGIPQLLWILLIVAAAVSIVGLIGDQWIVVGLGSVPCDHCCHCQQVGENVVVSRRKKYVEMERFVKAYIGQEAMIEALFEKVRGYHQKQSRLAEAARDN